MDPIHEQLLATHTLIVLVRGLAKSLKPSVNYIQNSLLFWSMKNIIFAVVSITDSNQ